MKYRYNNSSGMAAFDIDLGTSVVRLGSLASGLVDRAELGEPGAGGIALDDPDGTLDILPLQYVIVEESEAPAGNRVVHIGLIGDENVVRGDASRASLRTGAARVWELDLQDPNAFLAMRLLHSFDRPAETADVRLSALLAVSNCPVHDLGLVAYPTHAMDKNDYSWQSFQAVLGDIAAPAAFNYFAYYDETALQFGLFFDDPSSSAYASTAMVSNVLTDIGPGTYAPLEGTTRLNRSPSRIASTAVVQYPGGTELCYSAATADLYTAIDRVAPSSNIKTAAKALAVATKYQEASDGPDDRIYLTVRVPAANVNDIRAGHRLEARFSHLATSLADYSSWTPFRVMSRAAVQDEDTPDWYKLALELTPVTTVTCPASLGAAVTDSYSERAYSGGSTSIGVTPAGQSLVVAVMTAGQWNVPGDTGMALSGVATLLAHDFGGNDTTAMGYTSSSSPVTVTGSYTAGYNPSDSRQSGAIAALRTSASSPVQSGTAESLSGFGGIVTLGATPTPGNMLVMLMGLRSLGGAVTHPDESTLAPSSGWTLLAYGYATTEPVGNRSGAAIWVRCVSPGDGRDYGQASGSYAASISVTEWAVP